MAGTLLTKARRRVSHVWNLLQGTLEVGWDQFDVFIRTNPQ